MRSKPLAMPGTLSVVLLAHNEAQSIETVLLDFYRELGALEGVSITVWEDGSTDGTPDVLDRVQKTIPIEVFTAPDRLGYNRSTARALQAATGDFIFFSDSDGQYDPHDFWELLAAMDGLDMVVGRKVHRNESFHRILLSMGFHFLVQRLFGVRLHDIDCGFRIIRKDVILRLLPKVRDLPYSFWAEFTIMAYKEGLHLGEVPVFHRERLHGITTIYHPRKLPKIILAQLMGLVRLRRRFSQLQHIGVDSEYHALS